jgi:4-diphosphocytidyl-2-C-methyl-D-erythritol kinase
MIKLLDERFRLNIGNAEMERYAAKLGADCAFFISAEPSYATGIGDVLEPVDGPKGNLNGYYIAVIKPDIAVSTKEAYAQICCSKPVKNCRDIVRQPIETWKNELVNDFETPVFNMHPELKAIKEKLYDMGAEYAAMSGSGSSLFGLFKTNPKDIQKEFSNIFTSVLEL